MAELANTMANPRNFKHYESAVIEQYKARELRTLGELIRAGQLDALDAKTRFDEIEQLGQRKKKKDKKQMLVNTYDRIMNADGKIKGVRYGFTDMDKATQGFH